MDSLMFTFSADQMSIQLGLSQKLHDSTSKTFKRRPSSSKTVNNTKSRMSSSNKNQLFENCQIQNGAIEQSPEKSLNNLRIKNSSIQIQEKRKLRNIIDNMLGKNFDTSHNPKLDSIVISNRKNINRHRGYLNGTKKQQQKQSSLQDKESKQNQFNLQNVISRPQTCNDESINEHKIKSNLKTRKFQFANIKINKMTHHSQRYHDQSKNQESQNIDKRLINISRESIDRQSLGKKVLRSKTPKIMYPQSDSKLPSVFRNPNARCSLGESLKKRTRISSAHFIADTANEKTEDSVFIPRKKTLQNPPLLDASLRQKFRPQSTMLQTKKYSTASERNDQNLNNLYHPKKLIFDCNKQLCESIANKLGSNQGQNRITTGRVSTRAKSTHVNYVHRKLRQINTIVNEPTFYDKEQKMYAKNESHHSRQTAQASDFQDSTDRTILNLSEKMTKSIQEKETGFISGLGHCITFQAHKQ